MSWKNDYNCLIAKHFVKTNKKTGFCAKKRSIFTKSKGNRVRSKCPAQKVFIRLPANKV
jgi:hypothetical protein